MIFSLLRYKYDERTYDRIRVNNKYPFPLVLDMRPVMKQHTSSSSSKSSSTSARWEELKSEHKNRLKRSHQEMIWLEDVLQSQESEREMRARSKAMGSSSDLIYELCAVIIQSGSVRSGHYHALVRDVSGEGVWNISSEERKEEKSFETGKGEEEQQQKEQKNKLVEKKKKRVRLHDGAVEVLRDVVSRCKSAPNVQSVGSLMKKYYGKSWSQVFRDRHGSLIRFLKSQSKHFRIVKDRVSVVLSEQQPSFNPSTKKKNEFTKKNDEWTTVKSSKTSQNTWTTVTSSKKKSNNDSWTTVTSSKKKRNNEWTTFTSPKNVTTKTTTTSPSEKTLSEHWGKWFDFNDSSVRAVSMQRILDQFQGKDSAYMLVYRSRKLSSQSSTSMLPKYWQEHVRKQNEILEEKRRAYEDYENKILVVVRSPSYFCLDVASQNSLLISAHMKKKNKKNTTSSSPKKKKKRLEREPTKTAWNVVGKGKIEEEEEEISKRLEILSVEKEKDRKISTTQTNMMETVFTIDRRRTLNDLINTAIENLKNDPKLSKNKKNVHFNLIKRCGESFAIVSRSFHNEKNKMLVSELLLLAKQKDSNDEVLEMIAWNGKTIEGQDIKIGAIDAVGRVFRLSITIAYNDSKRSSDTFELVVPEKYTLSQLREAIVSWRSENVDFLCNEEDEEEKEKKKNIEMYLLEKGSLKQLIGNFYKRDKSLEVWGITSNSEIFVQSLRTTRKGKGPVERELSRRNRTVLVEICDRRDESSNETIDLRIDNTSTFEHVKSCAVKAFVDVKNKKSCRLRNTSTNLLLRDETCTFRDADMKGNVSFWLEDGLPLESSQIGIRTVLRGSAAEKEIIMDESATLLKLKHATCEAHKLENQKKWRLRKTNAMGDPARIFQDELKTCGSQLRHGSMIMIENGELPKLGMLRLRLILWMPTTKHDNNGEEEEEENDEAILASRMRSKSLKEIKKVEIHESTTVKELKSKLLNMSEFAKWNKTNPKCVRLRFMGLSNYPGVVLKDENAELISFRELKKSKNLGSATNILIEITSKPWILVKTSLVLFVQMRNARTGCNEPSWPPKQIVLGNSVDVPKTFEQLQIELDRTFGIDPQQQKIAKFNVKRQCWTVLQPPGVGTSGKRNKKKKRNRLDGSPYSLTDGTLIAVLDLMTDPDDSDDFLRPEDVCRLSKLRAHRNAAAAGASVQRDKERSRSAEDGVKLNYAYEF